MPSETPRTRLFADVYDPRRQGQHAAPGDAASRASYLARLRLDAFLRKKIVIVDSNIIDGTFFLDAATESLVKELPLDRIEVRLRKNTFEESILLSFCKPNQSTLIPYFLDSLRHSLRPAEARRVQEELRKYPSAGITKWTQIPGVFKNICMEAELAEKYERSWAIWCELIRNRRVAVGYWPEPAKFPFDQNLAKCLKKGKGALRREITTKWGKNTINEVLAQRSRNDVAGVIDRERNALHGPDTLQRLELESINSWYDTNYKNIQAIQHECGRVEVTYSADCLPITPDLANLKQFVRKLSERSADEPPDNTIEMPPTLVHGFANRDLKAADYNRLLETPGIMEPLNNWYEHDDGGSLHLATDKITRELDKIVNFQDTSKFLTNVVPYIRWIATLSDRAKRELIRNGTKYGSSLGQGVAVICSSLGFLPAPLSAADDAIKAGGVVGTAVGAVAGLLAGGVGIVATKAASALEELDHNMKIERVVQSILEFERRAKIVE